MGEDTHRLTDELINDRSTTEESTSNGTNEAGETGTDRETESASTTDSTRTTTTADTDAPTTGSSKPNTTETTDDEPDSTAATVIVENEPITIDTETTAAELKAMTNANKDDLLTFRPAGDGQARQIDDDERVLDCVDPGENLAFQPVGSGPLFG